MASRSGFGLALVVLLGCGAEDPVTDQFCVERGQKLFRTNP